jgi:dolichyl-phosphate-mannose-protein mannosyltransferase
MLAHMLDHFVFSSRQLSHRTKLISFGVCVFVIVGTFWWFKGVAFGIDGPITAHTGLLWRKVSRPYALADLTSLMSWMQSWNIYSQ